jgi:hypothetical protein
MDPEQPSIRLPSISVVLSPESSKEDAEVAAIEKISGLVSRGQTFKIIHVEVIKKGDISTHIGIIDAVRYSVSFQIKENVVYIHPDFLKIMKDHTDATGLNLH